MSERLIIDGNAVYEIDEDCLHQQEAKRKGRGGQRRAGGRGEWQVCQESGKEKKPGRQC